ncbi:MAG: biopolymer transporter ExbB [Magnetococcales bacterium]|nr:biopolymer transporter ExbB [Magnetococcales bacterium]
MAWWVHADGVVRGIFVLLIVLSVVGWTIILHKWRHLNRLLQQERQARLALNQGEKLESRAILLGGVLTDPHLHPHWEAALAQAVREKRVDLESGLTFLASIGVSTPFIGLLGTVWGIMHALAGLGQNAAVSMELVAGPVAEALVATAAGLFAAIPAAVGYNLLVRRLRRLLTLAEGNLLRWPGGESGGEHGRRSV